MRDIFLDFTDKGRPWRVRFLRKGDRYGRDRCLTHDELEPMVEFYDRKFAGGQSNWGHSFPDEGQFVSRYYLSSLLKCKSSLLEPEGGGLNLDGGIEAWSISAKGMHVVVDQVEEWQAWTIIAGGEA